MLPKAGYCNADAAGGIVFLCGFVRDSLPVAFVTLVQALPLAVGSTHGALFKLFVAVCRSTGLVEPLANTSAHNGHWMLTAPRTQVGRAASLAEVNIAGAKAGQTSVAEPRHEMFVKETSTH